MGRSRADAPSKLPEVGTGAFAERAGPHSPGATTSVKHRQPLLGHRSAPRVLSLGGKRKASAPEPGGKSVAAPEVEASAEGLERRGDDAAAAAARAGKPGAPVRSSHAGTR